MPAIKLKKATQEYLAEKEREARKDAEQAAAAAKTETAKEPHHATPAKQKAKFLESEIITEKRKRTVPPQELRLAQWLTENVEKKEGVSVSLPSLYDCYTEMCKLENCLVVDITDFSKAIKEKVGKSFGLTDSSQYKGLLKEKKTSEKKPKVQGETLNMKMKDILEEVINEAGNPIKGIRYVTLKQLVANKYPALQIDYDQHKLVSALERGVRFGQIRLVKGTGKCGYYRIPVENEAELEEEERQREKEQERIKKEKKGKISQEAKEGEGSESSEEKQAEAKPKGRGKKRKSGEMEAEGTENGKKTDEAEGEEKKAKKKKKKNKRKVFSREIWESNMHSEPKKIQDTFPLAITYMADPKEASVGKIKKYVQDHYNDTDVEKLKKALERGVERGYWEQISGSGMGSGSFRLQIDEFDPANSESYEDRICQAIVATHEPKQCSAGLIKKYILDYHPEFKIDRRPNIFKKALENAVKKNKIRQISGIGAMGSFQLVEQFSPSPAILAGETDEAAIQAALERFGDDEKAYKENYVVRRTKSGRMSGFHGFTKAEYEDENVYQDKNIAKKTKSGRSGQKRRHAEGEYEDDNLYQEKYVVRKTKSGRLAQKRR